MEKSPNGNIMDMPGDNKDLAIEIFETVKKFMEDELPLCEIDRGAQWVTLEAATVRVTEQSEREVDVVLHDVWLDSESVQQHFIWTVVFRCMRQANGHDWELESFSDHVDIGVLDEIGLAESESLQLKYKKEVKISMAENIDIVLMRTINDWSRPDGNVWSLQIEWSGSFLDSRRVLQLVEVNSPSLQVRLQQFDLHCHLRDQYISLHGTYPMAAAISAVDSSLTVIVSEELVGEGHGEGEGLLCAICHDMFSMGEPAKQLRCSHIYHEHCIYEWFYLRLQCPLCRDEY